MASVELLARDVDVAEVVDWISTVPFAEWPQQHPLGGELRPAMVNDLAWQGFGWRTDLLVSRLLSNHFPGAEDYNRMLSVVRPGHGIEWHRDEPAAGWISRVHVPLSTNPRAVMIAATHVYWMDVGCAYLVDVRSLHAVRNEGDCSRIHFMFDVRRA
jgi:aspartyl/asparaginyl beta-hydroxylase